MAIYATRMQIEETFGNTKNARFGWSFWHVRTRHTQRYAVILLPAALAGTLLTLIGIAAATKRLHLCFQGNTVLSRWVFFFFQLSTPIVSALKPEPRWPDGSSKSAVLFCIRAAD